MIKKVFCAVVFVLLLSSSMALAQYKVELLAYYQMGWWEPPYTTPWTLEDPYHLKWIDSGPQLTLHVPPSPKGKAIAFDVILAVGFRESMITSQLNVAYAFYMTIRSDIIPENIIVSQAAGILNFSAVQDGMHPTLPPMPIRRVYRHLLERDRQNWWGVSYTTGGEVPDDEKTKLINALITRGFDVEFSFAGNVQGIERIHASNMAVYINSISPLR